MSQSQLRKLAYPFPARLIHPPAKGKYGIYVEHSTYTERLLAVLGPFSTEVKQVFFNDKGQIDGIVLALTVEVDGRTVTIEEAGDCEQPDNWKTQGARLKDAVSDGIKRCSARLGLGLHLWSQELYSLDQWLDKAAGKASPPPDAGPGIGEMQERAASAKAAGGGAGAPPPPSATQTRQVERFDGQPGKCPACGSDVKDTRADHDADRKKPAWKCANSRCQGGSPKKNGNGNWPWASWDSVPEEWNQDEYQPTTLTVETPPAEAMTHLGELLGAIPVADDDLTGPF
jgi:hypothetical protein